MTRAHRRSRHSRRGRRARSRRVLGKSRAAGMSCDHAPFRFARALRVWSGTVASVMKLLLEEHGISSGGAGKLYGRQCLLPMAKTYEDM
eukprot:6946063-Prymnesium_polylepis.1